MRYTDGAVNTRKGRHNRPFTTKDKLGSERRPVAFILDYDQWIHLDAENLAETGIAEAYERLLRELVKYVPQPAMVEEVIDRVSSGD